MKKKIISTVLCGLLAVTMLAGCGNNTEADTTAEEQVTEETEEASNSQGNTENLTGKVNAEIDIKDYGVIKLELDADIAPITVTNFVNLAKSGFYDGLTFHRIISGFMIQGGDPLGNGTGGSEETIKGEFSTNGVENSISHVRGTISMARSMENDSASSQFFIVHEDSTFLDGQYAAFGTVTEGIEVVDAICEAVAVEDDNGTVLTENQPVINSVKIIE
ncbi:MAG: peptidylprolyl isomerase [Lachnospiraceae bacterium]|nr:peptidylprolyl isomerase [Lachnospiraceae bacterium]